MKKIGIIFILLGLCFISGSFFIKSPSTDNKSCKEVWVTDYSGELRKEYSIKDLNMSSKMKVSFPSIFEEGMGCNGGDDFGGSCTGQEYYLNMRVTENYGIDYIIKTQVENYSKEIYSYVKEVDCIEGARCFLRELKDKGNSKYNIIDFIVYINGTDKIVFEGEYTFFNPKLVDKIDYIKNNIKVTNDAEYKIGTEKDGKLFIKFKSDSSNNPYAYMDLYLDSKYIEVENRTNSNQSTVVKTNNSDNIELYFSTNHNHGYDSERMFYVPIYNDFYRFTLFRMTEEDIKNSYSLTTIDNKIIYADKKREGFYNIDFGGDLLLTVKFNNKNDESLINDFINYTGEYLIENYTEKTYCYT